MVINNAILTALSEKVGLRQRTNPQFYLLDNDLANADYYINSLAGSILKTENVQSFVDINNTISSVIYNDYLRQKRKDAAKEVLNDFDTKIQNYNETNTVKYNGILFSEYYSKKPNVQLDAGLFYGIHIKLNSPNETLKIIFKGLFLAANEVSAIPIYIFNSQNGGYITRNIVPKNYQTDTSNEIAFDLELPNVQNGAYYVGFFGKDVQDRLFLSNNFYSRHVKSHPSFTAFEITLGFDNPSNFLQTLNQIYSTEIQTNNSVLNAKIVVQIDYDELIMNYLDSFATILQYKFAIDLLQDLSNSTRTNTQTVFNRDEVMTLLNGAKSLNNTPNSMREVSVVGLSENYGQKMKALIESIGKTQTSLKRTPSIRQVF